MSRKAAAAQMHQEIKTYVSSYQVHNTKSTKKKNSTNDIVKMKDTFYNNKTACQLSAKEEKEILKETEYEFQRRQGFKRIFPSVDYNYYKQFFIKERPLNKFIDEKVMSKRRLTLSTASKIKQKIMDQNTWVNSAKSRAQTFGSTKNKKNN